MPNMFQLCVTATACVENSVLYDDPAAMYVMEDGTWFLTGSGGPLTITCGESIRHQTVKGMLINAYKYNKFDNRESYNASI